MQSGEKNDIIGADWCVLRHQPVIDDRISYSGNTMDIEEKGNEKEQYPLKRTTQIIHAMADCYVGPPDRNEYLDLYGR